MQERRLFMDEDFVLGSNIENNTIAGIVFEFCFFGGDEAPEMGLRVSYKSTFSTVTKRAAFKKRLC